MAVTSDRARLRRRLGRAGWLAPVALVAGFALFDERADRFRHVIPILLAWLVLCLIVFLPDMIRAWKKTALFLASTALMLLAVRYLVGPLILRHIVLPTYNLTIDHRPKPVPSALNEDGVYPDVVPSDYAPADTVLFFTGDSMTRGERVNPNDAFPMRVGDILGRDRPDRRVRVANGGWDSSSSILQLRQIRQIAEKYHPDLIVQAFDMTDFHDDLYYDKRLRELAFRESTELSIFRALYIRLSLLAGVDRLGVWLRDRFVATADPDRERIEPEDVPQLFAMLWPLDRSRPHLDLTWSTIVRTAEYARSIGADYLLVVLPRWQQYNLAECPRCPSKELRESPHVGEPLRFFREKAAEAAFPVVIPDEDFRDSGVYPTTFDDDFHYNEAGHEIAAKAVARAIETRRLASLKP